MKEYMVLNPRDKMKALTFGRQFRADKLTALLNEYAAQGWCVVTSAAAEIPGLFFGGKANQLIIILERDAR